MSFKAQEFNHTFKCRLQRKFSKELKKKLVSEIENNRLKVKDVVNLYNVTQQSVYRWLKEYSSTQVTGTIMVVESESQGARIENLLGQISDLERSYGQKQMEVDFLNNVLDLCSEELGYDVKKKYITTQLNGSK